MNPIESKKIKNKPSTNQPESREGVAIDANCNAAKWAQNLLSDISKTMKRISDEYYAKLPKRPCKKETKNFDLGQMLGRNRYRDIPCIDETRVKLQQPRNNSDYIHANYVNLPQLKRRYILTQAPLQDTLDDFWNLIWQEGASLIVCLTKILEKGQAKTQEYWPTHVGKEHYKRFGPLHVRNVGVKNEKEYSMSILEVGHGETMEKRKIIHYLYLHWPDHRVPLCTHRFLHTIYFLDNHQRRFESSLPDTLVVHCSAGVGRSGTLVALDALLHTVCKGETPDVVEIVSKIRTQRAAAIQGPEQYLFLYYSLMIFIVEHTNFSEEEKERLRMQMEPMRQCSTKSNCEAHQSKPSKSALASTTNPLLRDKSPDIRASAICVPAVPMVTTGKLNLSPATGLERSAQPEDRVSRDPNGNTAGPSRSPRRRSPKKSTKPSQEKLNILNFEKKRKK